MFARTFPSRPLPVGALRLTLATVALFAAVPAGARAAEAPLQPIGSGERASLSTIAISADGREILGGSGWGVPRVQNVATDTSETLAIGSNSFRTVLTGSDDLRHILFNTQDSFSPLDTNTTDDLYVLDRRTGAKTLVTGNPGGGSLLDSTESDSTSIVEPRISGDGNVVLFGIGHWTYPAGASGPTRTYEAYRFTIASKTLTKVANRALLPVGEPDTAGRVLVTEGGTYVGTRKLVTPIGVNSATVSPDGGQVAFRGGSKIFVLDTATGYIRSREVPAWLAKEGYGVWGIENGGTNMLLGALLARTPTEKPYIFGKFNTLTGELVQWGADIRVTNQSAVSAVTPDWNFAATNTHIAQLGAKPLPGGVVIPPGPKAFKAVDYAPIGDSTCINNFWYKTYTKPGVSLAGSAIGIDLRRPVKAVVVVKKDSSTWNYTLKPGAGASFSVGPNGRWSATATVTLDDGSTDTYSVTIPQHANPECDPFPL